MGQPIQLLNRVTGKLEQHDSDESDRLVSESGGNLDYPDAAQLERSARLEAHGSTGEQALAAVETVGRTASFGAWQGFGSKAEIAGRQRTLREESPGTAFGAQVAGTIAPAVAGGALASGALGAVGAGARIAGAAGVAAEGAAGGLAGEVEEAQAQGRPVSAGRAMLTGIGGEVLGRALPAAIRAGLGRVRPASDAAAVVTGEAVADVSQSAGKAARAKLADDAYHMPPGRARDEALAGTAAEQFARADAQLDKAATRAQEVLADLGKTSAKDLERHVPRTAPAQVSWAADTAGELRAMAAGATGAERDELLRAAKGLVEADDAQGIWRATAEARERVGTARSARAKAEPPADDLEALLSKSVDDVRARKAGAGVANDTTSPAIKRNAKSARVLDAPPAAGSAPDFSEWDVADFAQGRGAGKAAGKGAPDYSGGKRISTYQRSIVDGLKQNKEFASTGRISGDAGKLGSEPTFVLEPDGSVRLVHGRLRMTAARELGRDMVYGRVVRGKGAKAQTVFEGQIKVGGSPQGKATAAVAPNPSASALDAADDLLAKGQQDKALFGRAAEGSSDLHTSAQPGGADSPISSLEDQLAAAQRWRVGSDKAREELGTLAQSLRASQSVRDDTERAVAAMGAAPKKAGGRDLASGLAREAIEFGAETLLGPIPGAGFVVRKLWGAMDDAGRAKIARTVRGLLSPITSSGRAIGASRGAVAMTALQRFAGDSPDARSAYEGRRDMLAHVATNPALASQVIAQSLGGLAAEDPASFVALSQRMTEALQYTAANLPPTVAISLTYPTGVPITDSELHDVADLWNTAMEPESALDDIEHGSASTIQMRTLKLVHPDIYNDVRAEVFRQSAANYQSIPSQKKLSMDIMFGADGLAGPFATTEAARYVTAARNNPAAKKSARPMSEAQREQSGESTEAAGPRAVRTGVTNKGAR